MTDPVTLTRKELYDLVWSTPMSTLASRLGSRTSLLNASNYVEQRAHCFRKPELQRIGDQRVSDAHLKNTRDAFQKRPKVRDVQVVPYVDPESDRLSSHRGRPKRRERRCGISSGEGDRIRLRVKLNAIGTNPVRCDHTLGVGAHEQARAAPQVFETRDDRFEAFAILRQVPAVIARRLRFVVRHQGTLSRAVLFRILQDPMERVTLDVELGIGVVAEQGGNVLHVVRSDVALVWSWMNRDAVRTCVEA